MKFFIIASALLTVYADIAVQSSFLRAPLFIFFFSCLFALSALYNRRIVLWYACVYGLYLDCVYQALPFGFFLGLCALSAACVFLLVRRVSTHSRIMHIASVCASAVCFILIVEALIAIGITLFTATTPPAAHIGALARGSAILAVCAYALYAIQQSVFRFAKRWLVVY